MVYDLIDKSSKDYYIKAHKCGFIVMLVLSIALGVLSFFATFAMPLLILAVIIDLVFLFTWRRNIPKYGGKLSCGNKAITVYNHKGLKIKEFPIEITNHSYLKIAFDEYPRYSYKKCLVFYNNIEPYEKMEYSSYWNDPNIVIIQNPSLIEMIDKKMESINCMSS